MEHNHNKEQAEDLQLNQLEKITDNSEEHEHSHDDGHKHAHGEIGEEAGWKSHWDLLLALAILVVLLVLEYGFKITLPNIPALIINLIAWILAGRKVADLAWRKSKRGDVFNEFVLMTVATIGAFLIGEYEEGVAVMVFYQIGEWFQDAAVDNAKRNIKSLLDIRPDEVTVLRNRKAETTDPAKVQLGESIQVKPGEKVALDGELISDNASFNTAALTGESKPDTKYKGEAVYAGMINLNTVAEVKVNALFKDSKLSKVLEMVQDATARKSQTQLFISRLQWRIVRKLLNTIFMRKCSIVSSKMLIFYFVILIHGFTATIFRTSFVALCFLSINKSDSYRCQLATTVKLFQSNTKC